MYKKKDEAAETSVPAIPERLKQRTARLPDDYVSPDSVVRLIWGRSDTILFIFAGAAAEFALNKSVDWLYFTGRLPADPIGRLFSTVGYARQIIFADEHTAIAAIDRIRTVHAGVERARGLSIPGAAYRDVLFMLIHYSVAAFELLERPLQPEEKEEVLAVFLRVGRRMGITGLPDSYTAWQEQREAELKSNLAYSHYTGDLYVQYRKHLGLLRYRILLKVQGLLAPRMVRERLRLNPSPVMRALTAGYCRFRGTAPGRIAKAMLVPKAYRAQIRELDVPPAKVQRPAAPGRCPISGLQVRHKQGMDG